MLQFYLKGIQAYLPLEAIQAKLQLSPHELKQEEALSEEEILEFLNRRAPVLAFDISGALRRQGPCGA